MFQKQFLSVAAVLVAVGVLSVMQVASARAQAVPIWESGQAGTSAYASDCRDCEEERSVLLECERGDDDIRISLPGLAMEKGRKGARVKVRISTETFSRSYRGVLDLQEIMGYLPELRVRSNDPVIEAIASGDKLRLSSRGSRLSVPLDGSRKAITKLLDACF